MTLIKLNRLLLSLQLFFTIVIIIYCYYCYYVAFIMLATCKVSEFESEVQSIIVSETHRPTQESQPTA